ncbi:MAG: hypothetical protein ACRDGL_04810, partial [Candidatus Limnocylindrales bacterium]
MVADARKQDLCNGAGLAVGCGQRGRVTTVALLATLPALLLAILGATTVLGGFLFAVLVFGTLGAFHSEDVLVLGLFLLLFFIANSFRLFRTLHALGVCTMELFLKVRV